MGRFYRQIRGAIKATQHDHPTSVLMDDTIDSLAQKLSDAIDYRFPEPLVPTKGQLNSFVTNYMWVQSRCGMLSSRFIMSCSKRVTGQIWSAMNRMM